MSNFGFMQEMSALKVKESPSGFPATTQPAKLISSELSSVWSSIHSFRQIMGLIERIKRS